MSDFFLHRNGGGRITGVTGSVGSDCYVCPESHVEDGSFISCESSIFASAIRNSNVALSSVERSAVVDSQIHGGYVGDSVLERVTVRGARGRKADVEDTLLTDVVVEACKLRGFELHGPHLIHSDWDREPRHHLLESESGIMLSLIECGNDRFHAGCCCRPWSEWDEKEPLLRRYFLRHGWDLETFNSIRPIFDSWR